MTKYFQNKKLKIHNLNLLCDSDIRKKYIKLNRDISKINDYKRLRNSLFQLLGLCAFSYQLLEVTLYGIYNLISIIIENPSDVEKLIDKSADFIKSDLFNEERELDTSKDTLAEIIKKFKDTDYMITDLYNRLNLIKDKRNYIIHASVVKKPLLLSHVHMMAEYCNEIGYNSFLVAQALADLKTRLDFLYKNEYPNLTAFLDDSIKMYRNLSNDIKL